MAGKFEVYQDRAGKYRFRLKATNGQIVAVGEAYETKAAAMQGAESVMRAADSSEVITSDAQGSEVSIAIYLDTEDEGQGQRVADAVAEILYESGAKAVALHPPVLASFFQRLRATFSNPDFQHEINNRFEKIERGLEVRGIAVPESQANLQNSQGVAAALEATKDIPNATFLLNSLLLIKVTRGGNEPVVVCKTLNAREMNELNASPGLLSNPAELLQYLNSGSPGVGPPEGRPELPEHPDNDEDPLKPL